MKFWIPPLAALTLVGAWWIRQDGRIRELDGRSADLVERIRAAESVPSRADGVPESLVERREASVPSGPDWKKFGEAMGQAQFGQMPDMREAMRMQKMLMKMDADELIAALDEIAQLDLESQARSMLRSSVMGILMQKDPEQLIRQCFAGEQDPMNPDSHMMAHAFGLWAVKDPSGALSWFDQKVAEGSMESRSLDGRNSVKLRFEGALIGALMKQGGEAASRRLEALPAKDRVEVLGGSVALGLPQDRRGDFARMVRQHVPAEQQASMLARPVTMMVFQGGYDQVTEYLGQIDATAGERLEIAKTAMSGRLMGPGGSVDTKLQEATDWLAQVAPEHVDAITGAALGKWYGPDPDQRFELVERLHEEGGGDALLVAFLDEAGVYQNREAARRLAAKIESAEDRERLLGRLEDFQSVRPEITESPSP